MAKTTKSAKSDRLAKIEKLQRAQRSQEKRQGLMIVLVCVVVGVLIVGAAAYQPIKSAWDKRQYAGKSLAEIGSPASACGKIETKKANGNQDHVPDGTPVDYQGSPPAFGPHYAQPDGMSRKVYTATDRPDLRVLVHNLEHGYTFVWYDDTISDSDMAELRAVADKFPGETDYRNKFKAVPWTKKDGKPFPGGAHIAMTHWSGGGAGDTDVKDQVGVWQYCSSFSGAALKSFMDKYPYLDSPEPGSM